MGKINIAEILKNCPKGMELDCAMWDGVTFEKVQSGNYPIRIRIKDAEDVVADLTEFGEWNYTKASKCVIFPKGKTTWEGFVPPCKFKDGDIIYTLLESNFEYISIFQKASKTRIYSYVDLGSQLYTKHPDGLCLIDNITSQRLATKEEKQKLFQAMKADGYRWNTETKTLEKLIEPKFKVGDIIRNTKTGKLSTITKIHQNCYEWDAEKKELKKIEQKPTWTEEDESVKQWIISDIEKLFSLNKKSDIISKIEIDWLKSLKKRIGG